MEEKLRAIEREVTALAGRPEFIHHQWYVAHHLQIVDTMARELCGIYPQADVSVVRAMVWLHDLGKILTSKKLGRAQENQITREESTRMLQETGFDAAFIRTVIDNLSIFDEVFSRDLSQENIEVRIASTADGCAHFVGPFFSLYWYENPRLGIEDLISAGTAKALKDWERKIVLPEARNAFKNRVAWVLENDPAHRPEKFF